MIIEIHVKKDDYNTRRIEALELPCYDLEKLMVKLPSSCEMSRDEEASKAAGKSVWQLTGHGEEPLGEIQDFLLAELKEWDGKLPKDLGYDTDFMGVGYNSIYLVEKTINPTMYVAVYRVKRQYIADDGQQYYGHYCIYGNDPFAILAEIQEDAVDFDSGVIFDSIDTTIMLFAIVRRCDEQRNVITDELLLSGVGNANRDDLSHITCQYCELREKGLAPAPGKSFRELFDPLEGWLEPWSESKTEEGGRDE